LPSSFRLTFSSYGINGCNAATVAKSYLRSSRPAATVADVAVQRCRAQEEPLARELTQQLGKEAAVRILELVRDTDRSNLIRAIEEVRARQQ